MVKCCKVIPVYFGQRRCPYTRENGVLELVEYLYENEKKVDPGLGLTVDTVFVNNSPDSEEAQKFFGSINGTKTHSGKIIVIEGHNIGMSFGAYNLAFEKFRDQYDYWAFTEDDLIINKDNYFIDAINQMKFNDKIGFCAFLGIGGSGGAKHAHGGCGISSTAVLENIYKKNGCLPHAKVVSDGQSRKNWSRQIHEGEVPFTNTMVKSGFMLKQINTGTKPYIRWWTDHQNVDLECWDSIGYVNG